MEETNKRYRCWKCQQYLSRSVYYRHLRRNGCSDTRKTTSRESQKQRSVDMEVESFHIGNDSNALCNKDHTSATDSHLPDTSQETELVLKKLKLSSIQIIMSKTRTYFLTLQTIAVPKAPSVMVGLLLMINCFQLMPYVCSLITINLSFMYPTEECSYSSLF